MTTAAAETACPNCDLNPVTGCGPCPDCRAIDTATVTYRAVWSASNRVAFTAATLEDAADRAFILRSLARNPFRVQIRYGSEPWEDVPSCEICGCYATDENTVGLVQDPTSSDGRLGVCEACAAME